MRSLPSLFAILLFLIPGVPALAWSPEGHQVAAAVALRELTPAALAQVQALLGQPVLMVLESSWADEIRDQRPETSSWHYVNIPVGSGGYNEARDCRNSNCVVAQIARDRRILADPRASRQAKIEALRFLVHFVADLHQPLHASDHDDRGGNDAPVRWRSKRTSLHQIWDLDVVRALGRDSSRVAADIETRLTPQLKAQMRQGTPADWANESFAIARQEIYRKLPAGGRARLPDNYAWAESGVARQQLARAGIRLAAILNGIWR